MFVRSFNRNAEADRLASSGLDRGDTAVPVSIGDRMFGFVGTPGYRMYTAGGDADQ